MIIQSDHPISIKGIRDGLLVSLGQGAIELQFNSLNEELVAKQGFLRGSKVVLSVGGHQMNQEDIITFQGLLATHEMELWAILAEREDTKEAARALELATRLPGSNVDLEGRAIAGPGRQADSEHEAVLTQGQRPTPGNNSLLMRETIRSGRSIFNEGHVVVVGDVNPGAEIIAGGDVIVWGVLRGMVHAGAHGDESAVICALGLVPTQLRIADYIAISPYEKQRRPVPEMAYVSEQQIVAEAWPVKR